MIKNLSIADKTRPVDHNRQFFRFLRRRGFGLTRVALIKTHDNFFCFFFQDKPILKEK